MENLVAVELKRRGKELYYYKTKNGLEVDILIRKGEGIEGLIQVTEGLSDAAVRQRELKSLAAAMNELGLCEGLILTADEEEEVSLGDKVIKVKPIYKWLLNG